MAFDESDYVSAELLSTRPQAVDTVDIPYPEVDTPPLLVRLVLTLFIDEQGRVARVRAEDAGLPAAWARAAASAFEPARFTPGRRDGHAVKARIRIEVSFDARSTSVVQAPSAGQFSGSHEEQVDRARGLTSFPDRPDHQ